MKGSQRKQRVMALAASGILLTSVCYWLRSDHSTSPGDSRRRSGNPVRERQTSTGETRDASFPAKTPNVPRGFGYEPLSAGARNSVPDANSSLKDEPQAVLIDANGNPRVQEGDSSITELNVSGASQTPAELMQEVTAISNSKSGLFSQVRGLAIRHPAARIREQAVASLAEVANDLTISHVIEALIDPEPRVRERALAALYKLGNRVPIQALVDLAERRGDAQLRAQLAVFVEQIADRTAISQTTEGFHKLKE
jgi:hypothetical protein